MKTNIQKIYLCLLICACTLLTCFAFLFKEKIQAKADPLSTVGNFQILDGASIRLKEGEAGIKWDIKVSQAYYESLQNTYGKDSVIEFHTLVDNAEIDGFDSVTASDVLCTATPTFSEGLFVYKAGVIYDYLENALLQKYQSVGFTGADLTAAVQNAMRAAYDLELYARGYVKITTAKGEEIKILSEAGNVARSIRGIAFDLLLNGSYTTQNKAVLEKYIGGECRLELDNPEFENNTYSIDDGVGTVAFDNLPMGKYAAYFGAEKVGNIVVETTQTRSVVEFFNLHNVTAGKDYSLTLLNENGTAYRQAFRCATKVITRATELKMFTVTETENGMSKLDGYYMLGNSIDASNFEYAPHTDTVATADLGQGFDAGLTGTFDGNGYTIRNLQVGQYGLFGLIAGGTVKNVAFENALLEYSNINAQVIAYYLYNATLENVYLSMANRLVLETTYRAPLACKISLTTLTNCLFDVGDFVKNASREKVYNYYGSLLCEKVETDESATWSGVYVLSTGAFSARGKTASTEIYADAVNIPDSEAAVIFTGVKRYTNREEMGKDLTANVEILAMFDEKYWKIVDGLPIWQEKN